MNKIKFLLKTFSFSELVCIYDLKKQFPKLNNDELYELLKERNPELYKKTENLKEKTK